MKLVLLRHGESVWNQSNKFAGWADVELSSRGIKEARLAGLNLVGCGLGIDAAFSSQLIRAKETLRITLEQLHRSGIPVEHNWRLNERHYGALQGMSRENAVQLYGEVLVQNWRRGYEARPPSLVRQDSGPLVTSPSLFPSGASLPQAESLRDVEDRLQPYWQTSISPVLLSGKNVLVVAHGNSLRMLMKLVEGLSGTEAGNLKIETGQLVVYDIDSNLNMSSREEIAL